MSVVAVVLAAGSGERLGRSEPKAFVPIAGRAMLAYSLETCAHAASIDSIVLVVPGDALEQARTLARLAGGPEPLAVVAGGATRQRSVRLGLDAVPADAGVVVCHDAARPFASSDLFDRVVAALRSTPGAGGAIPVVPVADTVKRVRGGLVLGTVSRDELGLAQTPQAFDAVALRQAHAGAERSGLEGTDDATLLEAAGFPVLIVPGEAANFKITSPEDLRRAEQILFGADGKVT